MPRVRAALALVFVLSVPSTAEAVVPSGAKIVAHMTVQRSAPFVANYVETSATAVPRVALRVVSDGQGRARLDVQLLDKERTETRIFRPLLDEASGSEPAERAPVWLQWWMGRDARDITTSAHIDLGLSSLAHVDGTILWVVGAGPRQAATPQLQVERETGRLRRAVTVDGDTVRSSQLDAFIVRREQTTCFPQRLTLSIGGRDVTLVNTWLRIGDVARVEPKEFEPPVAR